MDFNTGYQKEFLQRTKEHWLLNSDARLYGSGRAAFVDTCRQLCGHGIKTLWMPAWICDELVESLLKVGVLDLKFYELTSELVPGPEFLKQLDPTRDALLVVDYFASIPGDVLKRTLADYSGFILLDAVHSWLTEDLRPNLPRYVTVFSGFRKLFWKFAGCIVTGGLASQLPKLPGVISEASPGFPRNLSLSPRHGSASKQLLACNNLHRYDAIAKTWPADHSRSSFSALRSPVFLENSAEVEQEQGKEWHWPDLYQGLSPQLLAHAESLKAKFQVRRR